MTTSHPAKYSKELLPRMALFVDGARTILDPFAGTGRIGALHMLCTSRPTIYANELEPEWAEQARGNGCHFVSIGDACHLNQPMQSFDAVVTSPTYGNRMADSYEWKPGRKHSTYHGSLGRKPTDGSSAVMQWGEAYRALHRAAWAEAWRVLVPGGRLVLNIADHYRDGELQRVPEWHASALLALGFDLLDWMEVATPRYGFGANAELRAPELVILFEKPGNDGPTFLYQPPAVGDAGLWMVQPEPVQLSLLEATNA